MENPRKDPIGLQVIGTGQQTARAFEDSLAQVGGSLQTWLALVSLKAQRHGMQPHLVGTDVHESSIADGLDRIESEGLTRRNGGHRVELTDEGEKTFNRLLKAVVAFDRRLRRGVTDEEAVMLDDLLGRLRRNLLPDPTAP